MRTSLITLCALFFLALSSGTLADEMAPRWNGLSTQQKAFLLEAFRFDAGQQALFHDNVPVEIKQAALDSLWRMLTPERRLQVKIYAHLEKPFDEAAESASRVQAPAWDSLAADQQQRALDAFRLDATQKLVWGTVDPQLRQAAFSLLWPYLDPASRQRVLEP